MKKMLIGFAVSLLCGVSAGNANALLIEGFESGNLSNYTVVGGGSGGYVSSIAAHDGNYGLVSDNATWIYRNDAAAHVSQGDTITAWVNLSNAYGRTYTGFGASAAGTYSAVLGQNTNQLIIQLNNGFGFTDIAAVSQSYQTNHWYKEVISWGVGGNIKFSLYDTDGTTLLNSVSVINNAITQGGIAFRGFSGGDYIDTYENSAPVPEPSTLILLGAGLVGLGFARKRFAKK